MFYLDVALSNLVPAPSFGGKADLYFLEYAINDNYDGLSASDTQRNIESMIKKIYGQNPYADIVMLFTTDTSKKGQSFTQLSAIKELAAYYGIPCIDLGALLVKEGNLSSYLIDTVHPNDSGYQKYASYITAFFQKELLDKSFSNSKLSVQPQPSKAYSSTVYSSLKLVLSDDIKAQNPNSGTYTAWQSNTTSANINKMKIYSQAELADGQSISYQFSGKKVWILCDLPSSKTTLTVQLGNKVKQYNTGIFMLKKKTGNICCCLTISPQDSIR